MGRGKKSCRVILIYGNPLRSLKQRSLGEGKAAWLLCSRVAGHLVTAIASLKWVPWQAKLKSGACITKKRKPDRQGLHDTSLHVGLFPSPDLLPPDILYIQLIFLLSFLASPIRAGVCSLLSQMKCSVNICGMNECLNTQVLRSRKVSNGAFIFLPDCAARPWRLAQTRKTREEVTAGSRAPTQAAERPWSTVVTRGTGVGTVTSCGQSLGQHLPSSPVGPSGPL